MQKKELQRGIPLDLSRDPRCANPACETSFEPSQGGMFFRFQTSGTSGLEDRPQQFYWLCQNCSESFTVSICENDVSVELRDPEFTLNHILRPSERVAG